jgi:flagellar hook-associated protein 3 FlgL
MASSESALGDAIDLMQRMRELVVQAGNASYADEQRQSIAEELRGLRQQLLGVANRSDGAGGYLFAGQGAATPPFIDGPDGVEFKGTAGQALAAASETLPLSVDGAATWMRSSTGNGVFEAAYQGPSPATAHQPQVWIDAGRVTDPSAVQAASYKMTFSGDATSGYSVTIARTPAGTPPMASPIRPYVSGKAIEFDGIAVTLTGTPAPGQDTFTITPSTRNLSPFDALDRLASELETTGRTGAQVTQTVQHGLRDLDATLGTLISVRSRLGGLMDQIDGVEGRLAEQKVAAQTDRSQAEDLDMVEAVSQFQARQTSYDAALKAYSMVQRLSLFEYIR